MKEYEVERYLRDAKLLEIKRGDVSNTEAKHSQTHLSAVSYYCRICVYPIKS